MVIPVGLGKNSYDIVIERGALERASEIFDLDRKVMIVTDSGVPEKYYCRVAAGCRVSTAGIFQAGEASTAGSLVIRFLPLSPDEWV